MPTQALAGTRLRQRRLAVGLRQADLAARAGISASYLNLIEHNRRRIGPEVLGRLASALGLPEAALSEGAEGGLLDDLRAAAADSAEAPAELDRIEDFAGRFPGWAGVLAGLHRRAGRLAHAVEALNDRMSHDPHLQASLHEMLSAVSSVRSTAGILAETEDIPPEWRARFHRNLHQDSERLAVGAEALVGYLDGSGQAEETGIAAPLEELEAWLATRDWHLPEVEAAQAAALEAEVARLASGAARVLARAWVARAVQDAQALPLGAFLAARVRLRDDPAALAAAFGTDLLTVFRRIAALPGAPEGLVICDGSGTLVFRKPVSGFALPRFGAACPLWPLFTALSRPMVPVVAQVRTAGSGARRFSTRAFCQPRYPGGFGGPELREAAMLILPDDTATADEAVPIGSTCRVCPRAACPARREPSIMAEAGA